MAVSERAPEPPLPRGKRIELDGRGTTFARIVEGPPGAPTVVLLHGWIASGGLNWFTSFGPLSERYRVIAPDLRGHGRGIRSRRRFRLGDCADDVASLLDLIGDGPAIVVGYSMGGPVAQLLAHRHPHHVDGLVLCATAYRFVRGARERLVFGTMMAAAVGTTRTGALLSRAPAASMRRLAPPVASVRPTSLRAWAAGEMRRHDTVKLMEAGQAIGSYNARRWIGEIDVPTTVVVTERDRAIDPFDQLALASAIPGAVVQTIDDGHLACVRREFGTEVVRAVESVHVRLGRQSQPVAL
jgi:pimeloyl-ACP methyl ester carboxylesterase